MGHVAISLTELEKTILLVFLVDSKGDKKKFTKTSLIAKRFPPRQRKSVKRFIAKLVRKKLLEKKKGSESYRLTNEGFRHSGKLLTYGVSLWSVKEVKEEVSELPEKERLQETLPPVPEPAPETED